MYFFETGVGSLVNTLRNGDASRHDRQRRHRRRARPQRAGLIRYKHGEITILDLAGLKKRSCECYRVTKLEFDRLLGVGPEHAEVETIA